MYKGETYTRSRQGSPATWTPWNKMLVEKNNLLKLGIRQGLIMLDSKTKQGTIWDRNLAM